MLNIDYKKKLSKDAKLLRKYLTAEHYEFVCPCGTVVTLVNTKFRRQVVVAGSVLYDSAGNTSYVLSKDPEVNLKRLKKDFKEGRYLINKNNS